MPWEHLFDSSKPDILKLYRTTEVIADEKNRRGKIVKEVEHGRVETGKRLVQHRTRKKKQATKIKGRALSSKRNFKHGTLFRFALLHTLALLTQIFL